MRGTPYTQPSASRWYHAGLGLLVLGLLVGCTRAPSDRTEDGRVIVSYWEKWTGFEGEAMQAVVDDFNASQDRIFVKKLTVSQIDQKFLLATAGGNPPDLAGLWSHSVNVYAEKSALLPLDHMLEQAGITRDDYIPVFWDLCQHRGFMWALPTTPASVALHWNKSMFREAGLDPNRPPRSLAELDAMAEKLTLVDIVRNGEHQQLSYAELTPAEKEAKEFDLLKVGHLPNEPGWWLSLWVYWFGGRLWDGDQTITADSPEMVEMLAWHRSHSEKYGLDNVRKFGASFGNFSSPQNPFLEGRVAMVLQGVWMYNFIDKYAPHLDWGAAPFPALDPEKYPAVSVAECDVLVIPRGARHPEAAFEFMRYVNTQAASEKLNLGQRKFSPLATVSPEFIKKHPNPYIETFINLAKSPHVKYVPRVSIWTEYKEELLVAADRVYTLLVTPEEALTEVQGRMQRKLDRVNERWERVADERLAAWSAL